MGSKKHFTMWSEAIFRKKQGKEVLEEKLFLVPPNN